MVGQYVALLFTFTPLSSLTNYAAATRYGTFDAGRMALYVRDAVCCFTTYVTRHAINIITLISAGKTSIMFNEIRPQQPALLL